MKGLGDLMKKAQQMKASMDRLQEELATKEVEAGAGGGMVTVRATGAQEIVSIDIDPSVIDPEEKEMLQDLVQAAVNEALRKSKDMMQEEMGKITGGLPVPDIFG
ncbi:YbaB/EbfC family nucleoid-associated protein [bacterium]|jgi:DNA-binding YbaB/EbfC family protein|nr:YbaB/EbfC family nucleoid-associated protein [bacterium]MDF1527134.1 YbaB/EbfC family nucleoid-associated protein [bacterium]MDT8367040.1 YbaB/EbfC family nucleoid-associated protein [bacterium]